MIPENYSSDLIEQLMTEITPTDQYRTDERMLMALKIDDAIKQKGLSSIKFAKKMHQKPSEISRWLSGTYNFSLDTLSDIQRVLNVRLINIWKSEILHCIKSTSRKGLLFLRNFNIPVSK